MVKYKDASKDQSSLITLNTVFLDTLYMLTDCHYWPTVVEMALVEQFLESKGGTDSHEEGFTMSEIYPQIFRTIGP